MKLLFNTWPGAFFNPGGGEIQLLQSKAAIERLGFSVRFYDMWKPQLDFDIFHQFSVELGVHHPVQLYERFRKKIVVSPIYWHEPEKDSFAYGYIRDVFDRADLLMTNSHAESKKLSRVFDCSLAKFHKVRNGISYEYLSDGDPRHFRERFGIDGPFLLTVANIDRRKNTERLLQALEGQDWTLVSIGSIRDPAYFDSFKAKYPNFIQLGPISDIDLLKSAYRACSMFVLPSLCETPGIAALEAASQGCRVAITSEGSTLEYFGDHVTYLNPLDVCSIRAGILAELEMVRGPELRDSVREQYTWVLAGADIAAGYSKLLVQRSVETYTEGK